MEHRRLLAGPPSGLLQLPDEVLLLVLRRVEAAYVASGRTSAEFLQLRAVCKKLRESVDAGITNLSRGIAHESCHGKRLLEVAPELQRQLARWAGLRRVELHVRGSNCALSQLVPALGQTCPGLTELRIVQAALTPWDLKPCPGLAHLTSLTSLETLALIGFHGFRGFLPPLHSLRTLEAHFGHLICDSPLPALEELVLGRHRQTFGLTGDVRLPHLDASRCLRRISLVSVKVPLLKLPRSLRVLDLFKTLLTSPLDLGTELPELAELLLVQAESTNNSIPTQGLTTLLSRGHLRRLQLHGVPNLTTVDMLPFNKGLTSLSLQAVGESRQLPRVGEAVATLVNLTELELANLEALDVLDISCLKLQRLKLESLPSLSSAVELGLETRLTSLSLEGLPLVTQLPDLQNLKALTVLELKNLRLQNWRSDSCSCLPSLRVLCVSELLQPTPQAIVKPSSVGFRPATAFLLDLKVLTRLTEIKLLKFGGPSMDLASLPLLEELHLKDCLQLARLSNIRSLPRLHSMRLLGSNPLLETLTIASCPLLTTLVCSARRLLRLDLEDLPLLPALDQVPSSLHFLRVASCPSMTRLELRHLAALEDLELSGLGEVLLSCLRLVNKQPLKTLALNGLAKMSDLMIIDCPLLTSVQVSGSPLTALKLQRLPLLTAPNLRIDNLQLHAPESSSLHSLSIPEPDTHRVHPPLERPSPQTLQGLRSLTLADLPGLWTLDQVVLQTELTTLSLQGLHLPCVPKSLGSLTALSELWLLDLEVACWDPLTPDSLPALRHLGISGGAEAERWAGLENPGSQTPPIGQLRAGLATFSSITSLNVSRLTVGSMDVSQLACMKSLCLWDCASLTRLTGIANLQYLACVTIRGALELQELAFINCPNFQSLLCLSMSLLHLHMENLPCLSASNFCLDGDQWRGSSWLRPHGAFVSLKSLKLRRLPALSSVFLGDLKALESVEIGACSSLKEVQLVKLPSLTSLNLQEPAGGFSGEASSSRTTPLHSFGCFERLLITDMAKLQSILCPPTLRSLSLKACPALTSLPLDNIPHLGSLKLLDVAEEALPAWFRQAQNLHHMEFGRGPSA